MLFLCIFPAECPISLSFVYMHIHIYIQYVDGMLMFSACLLVLCHRDSLFCGREVHGLNAMPVSAIATATAAMEEEWRT